MLFQPITKENAAIVRKYYESCSYRLCEYSTGVKLMWHGYLNGCFTEAAGCLIVRSCTGERVQFDYPVPGPEGDVEAALRLIEKWCTDHGHRLVFSPVPEDKARELMQRYPYMAVRNERAWKDYLYRAEDLANFAGRRYSGQRNHINKFRKNYPQARFVELTAADDGLIERFWQDYEQEFRKVDNESARKELSYAKEVFRLLDRGWFVAGGLVVDDRLVALSLGEKCGDTLQVHIEKALYSHAGAYPTMVQTFAQRFGDDVTWIDRQDDAHDKGLRTSKLQYLPAALAGKVRVAVGCELDILKEIPTLQTERLTLDALRDEDKAAYNALCMDDERNRWWGYDYRQDLQGQLTEDYFLDVARRDFERRWAVNFAIRLDGKLIGEAVLYNVDWRGGIELGCRIAPEYAGHGYGTEAFAAAAEWGLYGLLMERVVAKCYKENAASYRMLSSCMRKTGEDDTFFYFEKLV
ncbi:MAG: GNAT family N-acetyltransferase [Oscillospiraceae bacterium]|nr:GNAT family N-acetyltransferase [Oscillospiraceae bacterium]